MRLVRWKGVGRLSGKAKSYVKTLCRSKHSEYKPQQRASAGWREEKKVAAGDCVGGERSSPRPLWIMLKKIKQNRTIKISLRVLKAIKCRQWTEVIRFVL